MALSLSNGRLFSAFSDLSTILINRRKMSASSSNAVANAVTAGGSRQVMERVEEKPKGEKSSWVPDPVTGYFVPEDQVGQTDAAQLRRMLLNHRSGGANMS